MRSPLAAALLAAALLPAPSASARTEIVRLLGQDEGLAAPSPPTPTLEHLSLDPVQPNFYAAPTRYQVEGALALPVGTPSTPDRFRVVLYLDVLLESPDQAGGLPSATSRSESHWELVGGYAFPVQRDGSFGGALDLPGHPLREASPKLARLVDTEGGTMTWLSVPPPRRSPRDTQFRSSND